MLSKVVSPLPSRAKSVVNLCWGNKTRVISLLLIIAMLSSCIPGGNQTQVNPTSTTQPQMPDCEATNTGFCWPTGVDFGEDKISPWLADSCGENDGYIVDDRYHIGWDISSADFNDDVFAISDGEIIKVNESSSWGEGNAGVFVKHILRDGREFLALYGHVKLKAGLLEQFKKDNRLPVLAGESFATVGSYSGGDHLHFGIVDGTTVPPTNTTLGIGWGMMPCPNTGDYNSFTDPYAWITTKSPLVGSVLAATAVQEENPTPTAPIPVPGATPIKNLLPRPNFSPDDYFVYYTWGDLRREEFSGSELVNGHDTWVFVSTDPKDAGSRVNIKSYTLKTWVDKETGKYVKTQLHIVFSNPVNYQGYDYLEASSYIIYNYEKRVFEGKTTRTDTEGNQHSWDYPEGTLIGTVSGAIYFDLLMPDLDNQTDNWVTTGPVQQYSVSEEVVSVSAGSFDCWVIHTTGNGTFDWDAYQYFDKRTGILIKQESWYYNQNGQREGYFLVYLDSFNHANLESKQPISLTPPRFNGEEYFSVLQWIKYATQSNDIAVFEDLIVGNSIELIDGNSKTTTISKADFLAELSKRLLNKPNCDFFMFEESGRLVVRMSGWSPGWGDNGDSIMYLILEQKNNQWVLTSIIYGDHPPSWAQGLERINYETISVSAGTTIEPVCKEARPTRLKIGDFAFISFYPPLNQRVRSGAGTSNSILDVIPVGSAVKILDGPQCADNWVWWKVRVLSSKLEGWTSEGDKDAYWLIPCESREGCGTQ